MDHDLTPAESLKVIESMINQAKRSFHRMSFYFLLWGVLLIIASLTEYLFVVRGWPNGWVAWPVLSMVGGVASGLYGSKESRRQGSDTMMDRVLQWIWLSFIITLVVTIACAVSARMSPGPVITILTGLPTFASGAIMRFRPLMVGGVLFWCIGGLGFFVTGTTGALLFAVAMLFGYIVPGYLLKRQEDAVRAA